MNALVVDTSSWIAYLAGHGDASLIEESLQAGCVFLPPLVVAELLSGRLGTAKRAALLDMLGYLPLCEASFDHWVRVGGLRSTLQSHGLSISTPDAHVAQCALDWSAGLLTQDKVFRRIAERVPLRLVQGAWRRD